MSALRMHIVDIDLTGDDSDAETVSVNDDQQSFACDDLFPPPVDAEENIYRVERILDIKSTAAGRVYCVKWFGYPISDATWEHERDMIACEDAVLEFLNSRR